MYSTNIIGHFSNCFTIIDLNNEIVNDVLVGKLDIIVGILVITQAHKYFKICNPF